MARAGPGVFFLYDRSDLLLHVWHAPDIRQAILNIWNRFSNSLRASSQFRYIELFDEQSRTLWTNFWIEVLRRATQS